MSSIACSYETTCACVQERFGGFDGWRARVLAMRPLESEISLHESRAIAAGVASWEQEEEHSQQVVERLGRLSQIMRRAQSAGSAGPLSSEGGRDTASAWSSFGGTPAAGSLERMPAALAFASEAHRAGLPGRRTSGAVWTRPERRETQQRAASVCSGHSPFRQADASFSSPNRRLLTHEIAGAPPGTPERSDSPHKRPFNRDSVSPFTPSGSGRHSRQSRQSGLFPGESAWERERSTMDLSGGLSSLSSSSSSALASHDGASALVEARLRRARERTRLLVSCANKLQQRCLARLALLVLTRWCARTGELITGSTRQLAAAAHARTRRT